VGACSDDDDDDACPEEGGEHEGETGATCDGSTLTYDNFGKQFMQTYCTTCHNSDLQGEDRNCAPGDHNFDTLDEILLNLAHIDEHAAAGPNSVNDEMPPAGYKKPSEQERRDLGTWLACEEERMP
jgi:uncharacterized membrane protein